MLGKHYTVPVRKLSYGEILDLEDKRRDEKRRNKLRKRPTYFDRDMRGNPQLRKKANDTAGTA